MWKLIFIIIWIIGVHVSIVSPTNDKVNARKSEQDKSNPSNNICEYCDKVNSQKYLLQSQLSEFKLCRVCYKYEKRHNELIPLDRRARFKSKLKLSNICQYCDQVNRDKHLIQSQLFELKLCRACYNYERTHNELIPLDKRARFKSDAKLSNICQYCDQVNRAKYLIQSQFSKFKLCKACYCYERKHNELLPLDKRPRFKSGAKLSNICQYCDQVNRAKYLTQSQSSECKLCKDCYNYEKKHNELIPLDKRARYKSGAKLSNICQYCDQVNSANYLIQSQLSEFKLCKACYNYERTHNELIPLDKRARFKFGAKLSDQQLRNINIQTESVENEIGCTNKRNRDDSKKENQLICQYCDQVNSAKYLMQSQFSEFKLCHDCYNYERRHNELIPLDKRTRYKSGAKLSNICQYCDQVNRTKYLMQSQLSEFKLCRACYDYEKRHHKLLPLDKRARFKFGAKLSDQQLRKIDIQTESVENEIGCTNKRNRDDSKKENQLNDFSNDTVITKEEDILYNLEEELRKDYVKTIDN